MRYKDFRILYEPYVLSYNALSLTKDDIYVINY